MSEINPLYEGRINEMSIPWDGKRMDIVVLRTEDYDKLKRLPCDACQKEFEQGDLSMLCAKCLRERDVTTIQAAKTSDGSPFSGPHWDEPKPGMPSASAMASWRRDCDLRDRLLALEAAVHVK